VTRQFVLIALLVASPAIAQIRPRHSEYEVTVDMNAARVSRADRQALGDPHIRPLSDRLVGLAKDVAQVSKEFRRLVTTITASDVVVYVTCDSGLPPTSRGRLSFLATAGGRRYLQARLRPGASWSEQAVTLGHELQHAVEIAAAPAIVDGDSLSREYLRIGFLTSTGAKRRTFETIEAQRVAERIRSEYKTAMRLDPCDGARGSRLRASRDSVGVDLD
jgi:hypothetical protein